MLDIESFDINSLTIDETITFEEIAGIDITGLVNAKGELELKGVSVARLFKALSFISARREDPNVTLEEVGARRLTDAVSLKDLVVVAPSPPDGDA